MKEKVNVLHSHSAYEHRKKHMSKESTEEFKYPCVYLTYKDGTYRLIYSSEKKGHFGVPKVIFSKGISHPIVDETGEYGITEFAYAIIDDVENLYNIAKALTHPKFLELMGYSFGERGHRYNHKAIALFKKDFWREYL